MFDNDANDKCSGVEEQLPYVTCGATYLFRRLEQVEAVEFAEEFTLNINVCIFDITSFHKLKGLRCFFLLEKY